MLIGNPGDRFADDHGTHDHGLMRSLMVAEIFLPHALHKDAGLAARLPDLTQQFGKVAVAQIGFASASTRARIASGKSPGVRKSTVTPSISS